MYVSGSLRASPVQGFNTCLREREELERVLSHDLSSDSWNPGKKKKTTGCGSLHLHSQSWGEIEDSWGSMARASIAELVNSSLSEGLKRLPQKIKLRAM